MGVVGIREPAAGLVPGEFGAVVLDSGAAGVRGHVTQSFENVLDRYMAAKTRELVEAVSDRMDEDDLSGACWAIGSFLDALTKWYVRRSRRRFWKGESVESVDKQSAYATLHTVLVITARMLAIILTNPSKYFSIRP